MKNPSEKPVALLRLEKTLGVSLSLVPLKALSRRENRRGYSLDSQDQLVGLHLGSLPLRDLSPLSKLTGLTHLYLGGNQISDLSPLSKLTGLTHLDLERNEISDPSPLSGLLGLKTLLLNANRISDLSPLSKLTSLTRLDLANNQISDLSPLSGMVGLKTLDLGMNPISDLSPLSGMVGLRDLFLWKNQISDLSPLSKLTRLTLLYLANNQISDLSPLSKLTRLTHLSLTRNQISDLSPLSDLLGLKALHLGRNEISDLSPLSKLTGLTRLYLSENQINDLSPLAPLKKLSSVSLIKNPITGIPLVHLNNAKALRGYFKTLEEDSQTALKENRHAKINLIGAGNVGKTQLFRWLTGGSFETERKRTHGTNTASLVVPSLSDAPDYRASLWDFGGQSYQHGTHSFFLRPQDFYLVLFRGPNDAHDYGYWLGAARHFSQKKEDGNHAGPLFLVQNVWSEQGDRVVPVDSEKMKTYGVSPDHCMNLDLKKCFSDQGESQGAPLGPNQGGNQDPAQEHAQEHSWGLKKTFFKDLFFDCLRAHIKSFGKIPKRFDEIRIELEENKRTEQWYLKREDFERLYSTGLSGDALAYLFEYLEFAGAIVYFREEDNEQLKDYVFVNPQHLSNWIYQTVLREEVMKEKNGVLDLKELQERLSEEELAIFKLLMCHFNLLFEEPTHGEGPQEEKAGSPPLVIPQFLPENDHSLKRMLLKLIPFTFSIRFEDFIYEGRIFNFISEYGRYAEDTHSYWRYGILFRKEEVACIVYYKAKEKTVHVHLEPGKESDALAREIFDYFVRKPTSSKSGNLSANPSSDFLDERSEIPSDQRSDQRSDKERGRARTTQNTRRELASGDLIVGSQLSTNQKNYIDLIKTLDSVDKEPVKMGTCVRTQKPLLLDVLTLKLLHMEDKRLKKVFISYSRKDVKYMEQLKTHLSILDRYGLIKTWTCEEISLGKWDEQIQNELKEADIVIYMVSQHFLASDYIMNKEVQKGLELAEKDPDKKLVCVLVGACLWNQLPELEKIHRASQNKGNEKKRYSTMDLSSYQFLPYHQYKNEKGEVFKEEIVPLESWGRYPYNVSNEAYRQIAERILKEITLPR